MYELLNQMESILSLAIIEESHQRNSFKISPLVPDMLVYKQTNKIKQLQEMAVVGTSKEEVKEYLDIALRSVKVLDNKKDLKMVVESISDYIEASKGNVEPINEDVSKSKQNMMDYAVKIMKKCPDCDVHMALACAMKDCQPGDCEIDDQYCAQVEKSFNEDEIEEVHQRVKGVNEGWSNEHDAMTDLSPSEKMRIMKTVARRVSQDPATDVMEALGMIIEDIPGLESADVGELFSPADIRTIKQMAVK